jgi:hypothetical protein
LFCHIRSIRAQISRGLGCCEECRWSAPR